MAVTTPIQQRKQALASTKPAADALKAAREADVREDAAIDAEHDLGISGTAGGKIKSDAGLGVAPEVEAAAAAKLATGTDGQTATTRARQKSPKAKATKKSGTTKPKASKPAAPKGARVSKLGNARTEAWTDKAGSELVVGSVIVEPAKGTVKSRCTRPEKDGSRTPMVGVETDKPYTKNGRTVKIPTFVAAECLLKKK